MFGTLRVELKVDELIKAGFLERSEAGEVNWPKEKKEGLIFELQVGLSDRKKFSARVDYQNFEPAATFKLDQNYGDFHPRFSWYGPIPSLPKRDMGMYSHKTAGAYLDASEKRSDLLNLVIYSCEYGDLRELYHGIRRGTMRPVPHENWSAEQQL